MTSWAMRGEILDPVVESVLASSLVAKNCAVEAVSGTHLAQSKTSDKTENEKVEKEAIKVTYHEKCLWNESIALKSSVDGESNIPSIKELWPALEKLSVDDSTYLHNLYSIPSFF